MSSIQKRKASPSDKQINLGFVTWNIGDNIHQSKITELVQSYQTATPVSPDILFVALQEIPVKIYGTRSNFKNQFYANIGTLLSNALEDYQIINTIQSQNNNAYTRPQTNAKNIELFTCTSFLSSAGGGFGIATFIFKKKALNDLLTIAPISVKEKCASGGTKGYCVVKMQIDTEELDVINTHMPFNDMKTTVKFVTEMKRWLHVHGYRAQNQVILGDLNSRSLLTEDCYAKNVTTCDRDETETPAHEKYCFIKDKLESLTFQESTSVENGFSKMRVKRIKDDNCNIASRVSKKTLVPSGIQTITVKDLVRVLHKSDVLYNHMNSLFPDFQESPIHFLPSYKRDESTGLFSLKKKENKKVQGRLPGYADRILLKGLSHDMTYVYEPLPVIGNDHLPVVLTIPFRIKRIKTSTSALDTNVSEPIKPNTKTKPKTSTKAKPTSTIMTRSKTRANSNTKKSAGGSHHKTRKNRKK